jgi:hypothetical protein
MTPSLFPDTKVAVFNHGPINAELYFDGKPWKYPIGKYTTVPAEVAYFHFALDTRGGKMVRYKKDLNPDGSTSYFLEKVASYAQSKLNFPKEYQEFYDWFDKGLEFKVPKSANEGSAEAFAKLS